MGLPASSSTRTFSFLPSAGWGIRTSAFKPPVRANACPSPANSSFAELAEKLQLKRGFDVTKAAETTNEIRAFSKVIAIPGTLKVIAADPDDDAFWNALLSGKPNTWSVATGICSPSGTTRASKL